MKWLICRRLKSIITQTTLTSPTRNLNGSVCAQTETALIRHFHRDSRARSENLRKINPKVPYDQAPSVAESLYNVIRQNAPLSLGSTWDLIKEGSVNGINSKTHMKIMLKWMRGRDMLKQICHHAGSHKNFLLVTLPEDPKVVLPADTVDTAKTTPKRNKRKAAKLKLRKKIKKIQTQKQKERRKE